MLFLGVDLAWSEGTTARAVRETGVVALDPSGVIVDAGWTTGVEETAAWVTGSAGDAATLFIDAPLVVSNPSGQRLCEKHVGQRYGRWKVSANSTNEATPGLAGVTLRRRLEALGWVYSDGQQPVEYPRTMFECYPFTTLVGVPELGYDLERPRYKRKPPKMSTHDWRPMRAAICDDLIGRLAALATFDPPLDLASHPEARQLLDEPSPIEDTAYKHREDLIDAVICAWTAAYWIRYGLDRCQVLGIPPELTDTGPLATIIAPARPEQRPTRSESPAGVVRIRAAGRADIGAVLGVWETARSSAASTRDDPDAIARLIAHTGDGLLVAEADGRVVGVLVASWDGWRGHMHRLAVLPEYRRRGIARRLVDEGHGRLKAKGVTRVTALVAHDDADATGFWTGVGYDRHPEMSRYVTNL